MRMNPFGRHLHSQIIWPLMLASIAIGLVATVVGAGILGRVIEQWVDENATSNVEILESRIIRRAAEGQRSLSLLSENPAFIEVLSSQDATAAMNALVEAQEALGAHNLMVLDETGAVIASAGTLRLAPGDRPLGASPLEALPVGEGPGVVLLGGKHTITSGAAMQRPDESTLYLVRSMVIDASYMQELVVGLSSGIAFLDATGRPLAAAVPADFTNKGELSSALASNEPEVAEAVGDVVAGRATSRGFDVGGGEYQIAAREFRFPNDVTGPRVYIAAVVGTGVAHQTRTTTTNLLFTWSIVAVLALLGLNWWVARSVSDPLAALSASVARVAEGDYSAKVAVGGSSELSVLTENFNSMTDSLRERSESLTKKVLELATLYEMSRALGATLDLDTLLDSVLDSAMRIFEVELGYVTMASRETGALDVRVWRGAEIGSAEAARVRSSMSEWVIREGRPLIFNPSHTERGAGREDSVSGALAALCVPLLSSEGTIGAITVGSRNEERRFTSDDVRLLATIANHVTIAVGNIGLFSSVQEAYLATVRALAAAIDAKDPYTRGHSDGVAAFALRIGTALELSPDQMIALEMAAYLHDIGKIGISEDILLKPGKLTESEMSRMRHHPLIGANILKPVAFPWPIAPIVRHHHEHFDGDGYPAGLRSEEIPLLARVLTVADAFEAMIADRPYRRGRSRQEAILELRRCTGSHFDPRVVDAFIGVLEALDDVVVDVQPDGSDVGPEELQAVYVAVCDGMFASFRRLGGPRLANNLELTVNGALLAEGVPLALQAGHLVVDDAGVLTDEELETHLRSAVSAIAQAIEIASGTGLADHFLEEALEALPERMRGHAARLGFQTAT